MALKTSIVDQFTAMLSYRFSFGKAPDLSFSRKPRKPIRETVRYPCITVTADNDPCLNSSLACEHVLACGHLIFTATPDQPCATNCHHVENGPGDLDRSVRSKKVQTMKNGREISTLPFYCDACIETEHEQLLPSGLSSTKAEQRRTILRHSTAIKRSKTTEHRKCYIGMKVTSVPCYSDGSVSSRYVPREEHHPYDTALPQIGDNVFEDIDPSPPTDEDTVAQPQEMNPVIAVSADDTGSPETDTVSVAQADVDTDSQRTETASPPESYVEEPIDLPRQSAAPPRKTPVHPKSTARDAGCLTLNNHKNDTYRPRSRRARPVVPVKKDLIQVQDYETTASTRSTGRKSKASRKTVNVEALEETESIGEPARLPKRKRAMPRLNDQETDADFAETAPSRKKGVARVTRQSLRQQMNKGKN
jgi:hypothetical protein